MDYNYCHRVTAGLQLNILLLLLNMKYSDHNIDTCSTDRHAESNRLFTRINLKRRQPTCSLGVKEPILEDLDTTMEFLQLTKLILKSLR